MASLMAYCPECRTEYVEGTAECADCQVPLMPGPAPALVDPETGQRVEVDTSRRQVRERFAELERARREEVARELRRLASTGLNQQLALEALLLGGRAALAN